MTDKEVSRYKQRQRLRMLYKYWKVGKIDVVIDTITPDERVALRKYYGIEVDIK